MSLPVDYFQLLAAVKGLSKRNLKHTLTIFRAYADEPAFLSPEAAEKMPQLVAQIAGAAQLLQPLVAQLHFAHNMLPLQFVKDREFSRIVYSAAT